MIIGIDIGGTKTKAVLFDEKGNALITKQTGSCHLMNADPDVIIERLKEVDPDGKSPIVIGYAGYGRSPEMRQEIDALVQKAYPERKVTILTDLALAQLSALEGKDGTMVILGTGSVAVSFHQGITKRKGGWGYLLGDEGAGYAIGRSVLRQYALEADDRREKDALYSSVNALFHLDNPNELIAAVMKNGAPDRTKIASAAQIAFAHPDCCQSILKEAAEDAADLIKSTAEKKETVIGMGGLMHSAIYMQMINEAAEGYFTLVPGKHEPVYGAVIYAEKEKAYENQK